MSHDRVTEMKFGRRFSPISAEIILLVLYMGNLGNLRSSASERHIPILNPHAPGSTTKHENTAVVGAGFKPATTAPHRGQ